VNHAFTVGHFITFFLFSITTRKQKTQHDLFKNIDFAMLGPPSDGIASANGAPPDQGSKRPNYAAAVKASLPKASGPPVTRSSLKNALTFDLRSTLSELPKLAKTIADAYKGKIAGVQYLAHAPAVPFGFCEGVELSTIIEDGFGINGQLVPKYRCYKSYANVVSIALSQLPCMEPAKEKALIEEALAECGKVVDIRFFYDPHTGVRSTRGHLHLDQTPVEGRTFAPIPNTIRIDGFDIILSWRGAPAFCAYCRKPGHVKSVCELKKASDVQRAQRKRFKLNNGSAKKFAANVKSNTKSENKSKTTVANQASSATSTIEDATKGTAMTDNAIADGPAADAPPSREDAKTTSQVQLKESCATAEPKCTEPLDDNVEQQPKQASTSLPPPAASDAAKLEEKPLPLSQPEDCTAWFWNRCWRFCARIW
jgi:hypothetical protein